MTLVTAVAQKGKGAARCALQSRLGCDGDVGCAALLHVAATDFLQARTARTMQSSFTKYGWFLCLWVLLIPFQYGYHISVLNQIHSVLSCNQNLNLAEDVSSPYHPTFLPTCIPMSDWTFSAITAIFTLGGLTGSLLSNVVMDRYGRKGAARVSAVFVTLGTGLMGVSGGVIGLGLGRLVTGTSAYQILIQGGCRFLVGVGSGVGLCVAPIYISEIAPSRISGTVGTLRYSCTLTMPF